MNINEHWPARNVLGGPLTFVAARLESMLRQPAIWGSLLSIEERILQLLELRRVLLVPSLTVNDTHQLLRSYSRFISEVLDDATVEPLAVQLEQRGRIVDFPVLMGKFIEHEFTEFPIDIVPLERTGMNESDKRQLEAARNMKPNDCNIAAVGCARRCSSGGRYSDDPKADGLRKTHQAPGDGLPMSGPSVPPDQVVKRALEIAANSPCRSKRGVVLFDPHGTWCSAGYNGPPHDACPGRAICAGTCGQLSVHAEVRALRGAQIVRAAKAALGGRLEPLDLVHVERSADGGVVACDGPSCPGCAAQILDSGFVDWVWLYEGINCRFCSALDRFVAPGIHLIGDGPATWTCEARASWHRYTTKEFYCVALEQCRAKPRETT